MHMAQKAFAFDVQITRSEPEHVAFYFFSTDSFTLNQIIWLVWSIDPQSSIHNILIELAKLCWADEFGCRAI